MALPTDRKRLINQTLRFANLKRIKSTKQVEDIFSPALKQTISPEKVPFHMLIDDNGQGYASFQEAEQAGIKAFERDQAELQGQLRGLIENFSQSDYSYWLNEKFEEKKYSIRPIFSSGILTHVLSCDGVEAAYAYAIALLIHTGRTKHLRQCPQCKKYFIIVDSQKLKTKYCRAKCQQEAVREKNRIRSKKFRQKKTNEAHKN